MTRIICLGLVLANVGYFAWHAWIVPSQGGSITSTQSSPVLLLAREAPATVTAPAMQEPPSFAGSCASIGPFLDLTETVKTAAALRRKGMSPRHRAVEGAVWAGYWVALEGIQSVRDADAAIAQCGKDAEAFIAEKIQRLNKAEEIMKDSPSVSLVCAFDGDKMLKNWYEGIFWLEQVFRCAAGKSVQTGST